MIKLDKKNQEHNIGKDLTFDFVFPLLYNQKALCSIIIKREILKHLRKLFKILSHSFDPP